MAEKDCEKCRWRAQKFDGLDTCSHPDADCTYCVRERLVGDCRSTGRNWEPKDKDE